MFELVGDMAGVYGLLDLLILYCSRNSREYALALTFARFFFSRSMIGFLTLELFLLFYFSS